MRHTKLVKDLDRLRTLAFPPPDMLLHLIQDAERRGYGWQVIMAYESRSDQARWVLELPESKEAQFFSDGETLTGRWDAGHELFVPEEGSPLNLLGKPVSISSLEAEEEDASSYEEERKWELVRQGYRKNGSLSWG